MAGCHRLKRAAASRVGREPNRSGKMGAVTHPDNEHVVVIGPDGQPVALPLGRLDARPDAGSEQPSEAGNRRLAGRHGGAAREGHAHRHHDQAAARGGPGGSARRRQPHPAARDPQVLGATSWSRAWPPSCGRSWSGWRCRSATTTVPSDAELRIAQAQLVGWLEGLFHGIQTALFAQQMAARAQLEQMRQGALPPGLQGGERGAGHGNASGGQYL